MFIMFMVFVVFVVFVVAAESPAAAIEGELLPAEDIVDVFALVEDAMSLIPLDGLVFDVLCDCPVVLVGSVVELPVSALCSDAASEPQAAQSWSTRHARRARKIVRFI